MQIEINGETERLILSAIEAGDFASAEEFIAAIAKRYRNEQADSSEFHALATHITVDELAFQQRVGVLNDFRSLNSDFWPDGESVDDFVHSAKSQI
ncbi:MAG: hypothetical protein R3C28_14480 [Pirellulaceae bacterium]